jgi:co-chaperonin GroES (HSP10)
LNHAYTPSVRAEMSNLKPMGDYVLVKRLENDNPIEGLWLPKRVQKEVRQLRRGTVVAVGFGDPFIRLRCLKCHLCRNRLALLKQSHREGQREPIETGKCKCGSREYEIVSTGLHAPMEVKLGDQVLYWRSPANDVRINGQEYVMLHEEQHLVAILEAEEQYAEAIAA